MVLSCTVPLPQQMQCELWSSHCHCFLLCTESPFAVTFSLPAVARLTLLLLHSIIESAGAPNSPLLHLLVMEPMRDERERPYPPVVPLVALFALLFGVLWCRGDVTDNVLTAVIVMATGCYLLVHILWFILEREKIRRGVQITITHTLPQLTNTPTDEGQ